MRGAELPGFRTRLAPLEDVVAVGGELDDPVVAVCGVAVSHEDASVGGDEDIVRLVEGVPRASGDPRPPERHEELPVRAELLGGVAVRSRLVAARVGDPDVAGVVQVDPVRPDELAGAPPAQDVAVLVELEDDVEPLGARHVRVAAVLPAAVDRPDRLSVRGDLHRARRPPAPPVGERREVLEGVVGVRGVVLGHHR